MIRRIIIILSSALLLLLTVLNIYAKKIAPTIENKKYAKIQEQRSKELQEKIVENTEKREEKLENIRNTESIAIPLPETDEEVCRSLISTYFHHINSENYSGAYNMLDDRFKKINFSTLEEFTQYCKEKYTDYKSLEYIKYERRDDYLLVTINVKSLFNESETFEQNINIAEKGDYVYTLSFGIER